MRNNNEKKYIPSFSSFFAFLLGAILIGSNFVFGFTEPTQLPTQGNVFSPLDTSATTQIKIAGLILNTGGISSIEAATIGLRISTGSFIIGNNKQGIFSVQGATSSPLGIVNQAGSGIIADFQKGNGESAFMVAKTGVLFSSITTAERDSIVSPVMGLLIYNTTTHQTDVYDGNCWKHIAGGISGQCL